jgi:hypothetical protein
MAKPNPQGEPEDLYREAEVAFYTAKAEFERLLETVNKAIAEGRPLTNRELNEEDRARARLFLARVRLSRRRPPN